MKVTGLDPSLTSFGAAEIELPHGDPELIPFVITHRWRTKLRGHERLHLLLGHVMDMALGADLCVIEGVANYGRAHGSTATDLAGLHWLMRHALFCGGVPYAVVPAATRAKWLTGKGNASKDECLVAALKRFPDVLIEGNDDADAVTLAAMGAHYLGVRVAQVPKAADELLRAKNTKGKPHIEWPAMPERN